MWAKQSTAATVIIGPVLDSTGAEYASAVIGDLSISKNGGTLTALASAATLTLIANGQYTLVLTAGNIDTLGRAQITCNKSTYQMPSIELMVLPSTVFDALVTNAVNATGGLVGATAAITTLAGIIATTTNITAGTITTTTNLTNAPTSGDLTAAMKASVTAAVPTVANIQSGLATPTNITAGTITTVTNLTNAPTVGDLTATMKASVTAAVPTVASIQSGLATPTNITAATGITVSSIGANVVTASALAADAVAEIQSGLATAANLLIVSDGVGYITSVLLGTISDAGTAGETYVITFGGATYTSGFAGLDATGNRTGVTRTKV